MLNDLYDQLDLYRAKFKDSLSIVTMDLDDEDVVKSLLGKIKKAIKTGKKLSDADIGVRLSKDILY
jgi:hypothetical protein